MQLFTPDAVPHAILGRVCRQSKFVAVLTCGVMWLFLGGVPLAAAAVAKPTWWIAGPVLVYVVLVTRALVRSAAKAFRRSNWLLQIAPDGLWINLRSYQNHRFASAPVVLFVPYAEIASVAEHAVKRSDRTSGSSNRSTWTDRFLDIRLREPAIPELGAEIAEERRRKVTREFFSTGLKSHSRANHVPVTVPNDTTIRVTWRGKGDYVVPNLETVLNELSEYCTVDSPTERNLADVEAMTPDQIDSLILERVEHGETIAAMKLLEEKKGFTTTEAKNFVDELKLKL
jgi:hypothetical protein